MSFPQLADDVISRTISFIPLVHDLASKAHVSKDWNTFVKAELAARGFTAATRDLRLTSSGFEQYVAKNRGRMGMILSKVTPKDHVYGRRCVYSKELKLLLHGYLTCITQLLDPPVVKDRSNQPPTVLFRRVTFRTLEHFIGDAPLEVRSICLIGNNSFAIATVAQKKDPMNSIVTILSCQDFQFVGEFQVHGEVKMMNASSDGTFIALSTRKNVVTFHTTDGTTWKKSDELKVVHHTTLVDCGKNLFVVGGTMHPVLCLTKHCKLHSYLRTEQGSRPFHAVRGTFLPDDKHVAFLLENSQFELCNVHGQHLRNFDHFGEMGDFIPIDLSSNEKYIVISLMDSRFRNHSTGVVYKVEHGIKMM